MREARVLGVQPALVPLRPPALFPLSRALTGQRPE